MGLVNVKWDFESILINLSICICAHGERNIKRVLNDYEFFRVISRIS